MKNSALVVALALLATPALAFEQLRNDSVADGSEIAFYPRLQGEEEFHVVLNGPRNHDRYQVCRILVWIGPDDFNVFSIRLVDPSVEPPAGLIWQTDLDAYQIFGSEHEMSTVDLRGERIFTRARQIEVQFAHVPGADGPPTIASDTDGIQAQRNRLWVLQRNGSWLLDWTENFPEEGLYPRPPGDWIVRLDVVGDAEECPRPDAPPVPVDMGPPPPHPDMGPDDRLDMRVAPPDMRPPPIDMQFRDMAVSDAAPVDDMTISRADFGARDRGGRDLGDRTGGFAIDRIVPGAGAPDLNVDVVINGRGFPFGESITARLGDTRLLEATVRGESTITAIVPAGMAPGTYPLSVARSDGQEAILPSAYTVLGGGELALASVTPSEILEGNAERLSFLGAGFDDSTQFFVDTIELQDVVVTGSTEASGMLDAPLLAGTYDVLAVRGEHSAVLREALVVRRPGSAVSDDCGCRLDGRGPSWPGWALLILIGWRWRRCA